MKNKIIQFIALLLLMLTTGVFWGTWFTLTRSISDFSSSEFIHIGNVIIANVANPMKVIMPAGILFLILSTWSQYGKNKTSFSLMVVSLVLMIVTLLITVLVEVPIDDQIKTWTVSTIPDNWNAIREEWGHFHTLRTFTSLGGFASFCVGVFSWKD